MSKRFLGFVILLTLFLFSPSNLLAASGNVVETGLGTGVKLLAGCEGLNVNTNDNPNIPCSATPDNNYTTWFGGYDSKDEAGRSTTGAIPQIFAMSMSLYDAPPADAALYFADLFQQTPILNNTAYAQTNVGIGFASLSPVLSIWKVFRNISYLLFTLAFMVVGFAIMFRAKLNPQTVVNIQLALPRMIVTLLLITFSYAISGLLVDVMYISIYLIIFMFNTIFRDGFVANLALNNNILNNILNEMFGFGGGDNILTNGAGSVAALVAGALGFDSLDPSSFGSNIVGAVAGFGIGLLFLLIFFIVLFVKAFKAFFMLLSAYIQIIMLVITAPLRLILNIYPGSNAFMDWLKELAANLAVFPATIVMLLIGFSLLGIETDTGVGYATSQSTGFSPPQLFFKDQQAVMGLLGIGILLSLDTVGDKVKEIFGVAGGGKGGGGGAFAGGLLGGGIGAALAPGLAPVRMAGGLYRNFAQAEFGKNLMDTQGDWRAAAGRTFNTLRRPLASVNAVREQRAKDFATKYRQHKYQEHLEAAAGVTDPKPDPQRPTQPGNTGVRGGGNSGRSPSRID